MKTKNKPKSRFKLLLIAMLILGISPVFSSALPGQVSVVEAATNVKLNKTKATLIKGQAVQLKLTGTKGKVVWSSSNKKVASVSSTGKVTARAKGTATITAKAGNKKYNCKIQVEIPRLSKPALTLYKNGSYTLKMTDTKQKVVWKSSKISVVSVNSKGKITAKAVGTATVTATVSGKKYSCKVTVKQKNVVTGKVPVCVDKQTVYIRGDRIIQLPECFIYIKNLDKNAKVTDVKSTNPKIKAEKREELDAIQVSANGYDVKLLGETSTISFKAIQNNKTYSLSCKINVAKKPSPFAVFKIGNQNFEKEFVGSDLESASITGTHKVFIKMKSGYVLDYISVLYKKNGDYKSERVPNGSAINFEGCVDINANYHVTQTHAPANYVPASKWYGVVKSPLHDYCTLNIW